MRAIPKVDEVHVEAAGDCIVITQLWDGNDSTISVPVEFASYLVEAIETTAAEIESK